MWSNKEEKKVAERRGLSVEVRQRESSYNSKLKTKKLN